MQTDKAKERPVKVIMVPGPVGRELSQNRRRADQGSFGQWGEVWEVGVRLSVTDNLCFGAADEDYRYKGKVHHISLWIGCRMTQFP